MTRRRAVNHLHRTRWAFFTRPWRHCDASSCSCGEEQVRSLPSRNDLLSRPAKQLTVRDTVLILSVFILSVLSLYWAVLYHVESNMSSLTCLVVDFDGTQSPYADGQALVGPTVTQATEEMLRSPRPHLGYISRPPSDFGNDPMQVREAVFKLNAWAAVVVSFF